MSTARQFVEAFLQKKAVAYAEANAHLSSIYATFFGQPLAQRADSFLLYDPSRAAIVDIKETRQAAVLVTEEPVAFDRVLRYRYHLSGDGQTWRIVCMERACYACQGAGRLGESVCPQCKGNVWFDMSERRVFKPGR
jgi:hypothetical protein